MTPARQPAAALAADRPPVLTDQEVTRRVLLLAGLQAALGQMGVRCVLARNRRLVLQYNQPALYEPSGPTDPHLHVFAALGTCAVTTDGTAFRAGNGSQYAVSDPGLAAQAIVACLADCAVKGSSRP